MSWWLIPVIVIDVIAGIVAGLIISYFILKRRGKSSPLLRGFQKKLNDTEDHQKTSHPASEPQKIPLIEPKGEIPITKRAADVTVPLGYPAENISKSPNTPPLPDDTALIVELESNLEIASRPAAEKLVKFQTEVWNVLQSELGLKKPPYLGDLSDAYVDMLLANNIVWLVTDLGRDSPDFRASYSELKNRIALRLKRILPKVKSL
jgi:hypothetical protein